MNADMLNTFAPWSYIVMLLTAFMFVGGSYMLGKSAGDSACVRSTQQHDDLVRLQGERIEASKAQLRENSLRRIIINQDTAYRKQAAEGARLASALEGTRDKIDQQMKTFAERLRHVKKSTACILPADAVRLLNEGLNTPSGDGPGTSADTSRVPAF